MASLDGIITVLSGMSDLAQMEDNLSYMKNWQIYSWEAARVRRRRNAMRLFRKDAAPLTASVADSVSAPARSI